MHGGKYLGSAILTQCRGLLKYCDAEDHWASSLHSHCRFEWAEVQRNGTQGSELPTLSWICSSTTSKIKFS